MTAHLHLPAARSPGLFKSFRPNKRVLAAPAVSIQVQPEHSGIPRAMVLRPGHRPPQKRFRSAGLYFPTRWTVFAYPKFSLVCGGPRREPVFLYASTRGGFDAHGMFRRSSLAHLRWRGRRHWKHFAGIYPHPLKILTANVERRARGSF